MNIDINKKGTDVDTDNKVEAKLAPHDEAVKTTSEIDHGLEHDATDSTLTFKTENGEMEVLFEYPGGEVVVDKDASQHQVSSEKDSLLASNSTPVPEVTKCQLIQSVPKPMQTDASSGTKVKPVPSANFQNAFSKSSVNFNERAQETVLVPLVQNMNSRIECDPLTKPHSIVGNISHFPDYKKQISTPGFTMAPLSTKGTTLVPSTKSQNNVPTCSKPTFIATTKLQMPATTKATNSTVSFTLGPSTTQQNAASGSQPLNLSTILQNFLSPSAASQNVNKKLVHSNITLNPSSKLVPFTGTLNSTNPTYILVLRSTPHSTTESSNVIKNQDTVCKLPLEPQSAGRVTDRQNKCLKESFVTLESSRKKDDHLTAYEYVNVNKPIKIENVSETECGQFESIITPAKTSNKMKIENTSETEVCKHSSFCAGTVFTECQNTIKIEDSMDIESDQSNNKAMVESEVFLPVDKNENMFDTEKKVEHCLPLQNITMSSKKNALPASITIQGQLSVQTQPQSQLSMQIRPEGQLSVQTQPQSHLSVQIQPEGELSVQTHPEGQPSVPTQPQGQLLVQKLPQPQVSVKTKIRAKLLEQPQLRAKLLRQKPPFQLLVQTKPQDHPFVLNKEQKSQAKISKKKRKKKTWTKVIKTAKQECRTEEVGRFSSKAKSRDQMEVTLDRPWDLGTENIDLDQEDVADLSNSDTEMDTAQILHNPGEKKDKADSITNEPKRLDKVNSEFSVSTRNREIYISLRKERETGENQTIISTPVKKIAKKECRTEEVGRFSSEVNVSEHAYCTVGRGQMKATLDRPWDLGTENVDLDQENVADLSNSEMEMDTAQILHNPGDKKGDSVTNETKRLDKVKSEFSVLTRFRGIYILLRKEKDTGVNQAIISTPDLEIVDEKSIRKRKCLENVEKPQTEAESSSFIINKTEAININKSDIVIPGTNDKEDITAKPPDKKKKKRNIMTAGEKNYKGKLDDLDAKIRDLIRHDMIPMLPTGKLVCKFCGKEFWLVRSLQKHLTFSHLEKGGQIYISAEENLAYHFERRIEEMKKGTKELSFEHQDKKMVIPKMHTSVETEINLLDNSARSDIEIILTKISCSNDQLLNTIYTTDIWYCRTCNQNFSGNNLTMQLQNHSCGQEFSVLYIYPQGNITLPSESNDIPSAPYPDLESFLMENGLVFVKSTDTSGIETQSNSGIETQSNSGIMTQSNSGIMTQSNSGIETQSNSGIETQSNSGIETQSNSGIMTQSNSGIETQSNSGIMTQSNSETEINNKVESVSNFVEAAAAHVNESGRVVDSVNQVTSSVMNNSLNVSIIDNVPTKIQSKVGVTVSQVIDVLRNLSKNTKERESVRQVNRVPVSVCSITSEPPIVTKEPKSASKIAIEKMDVVESVNRACNLEKDSNKDSYASDIQGYSNDITGIVEKFKEAFKLKFGQDINKMRCPKCLEEVYLDDFDEHSCENIQLKNQVLRFCSGCKIGFLSESQLNAHTFFEHKDKSQDVNFGLDVQSDVSTRSLDHKELNTQFKQSIIQADVKKQIDNMLKTLLESNTITFDEIFRIFEQGHAQNMQNQIEDQKKVAKVKEKRKVDAGIVNSENTSIGCKICKTFTSCEKLSSHFYLVHCTNTKCCRFCEEMYVGNVHYCYKEKEPKYITRKIQMYVINKRPIKKSPQKRSTKKSQVFGQVFGQVFCHCEICKVGFLSLPKLNAHIFNEHNVKHECVSCEMIFASANCAEKHFCREIPKQLKEKNGVTGLYEICYDKQKDDVQNRREQQNQSITNYLKCPECDEEIGVDDFKGSNELQYQVIYTCGNCKLDFKSYFCTLCKCPFNSLEMLYSHFYSQHRKDTKCCLFCRLAYVGDSHYCGKGKTSGESSEIVTKREGSYYKMYYKKKFKKQKCLQCEYMINFCKENTDLISCSQLDCIACRKVGACHGDKCYICGQVFHSFSHRSYHEYKDHQDEVIELWRTRKKEYRREYLNDYNIKRYQQKRKDRHKCRFCDKRFTYSVKKKQHESDAHGVHGSKKYHCDVCDQKYGSFERMKKHMEEHYKSEGTPNTEERLAKIEEMLPKKDKRVMCHECGKLVLKKYLNAHLRIHLETSNDGKTSPTTVGKIACYKCGQMVKKKNFNAHFRERHKEKEVMCEICGKMFFHRGRLNEHKKIKHSEDIEKKVKKKGPPQQCNVCGKILADKKCLYVHEKMKHTQGKFQCQICSKNFFYNFLLRDHIKHVHEKFNPIVCHYCNYRCYMKSSLVKHMQYHH